MKPFSVIATMSEPGRGIGRKGYIPWQYNEADDRFKKLIITSRPNAINAVVMGKNAKALVDRESIASCLNLVISSEGVFKSLNQALEELNNAPGVDQIFVIGGEHLFEAAVRHPKCEKIYINRLSSYYSCDHFFPSLPQREWALVRDEKAYTPRLSFQTFARKVFSPE